MSEEQRRLMLKRLARSEAEAAAANSSSDFAKAGKWRNANQHEWEYTDTLPDNDYDLLKGNEDVLNYSSRRMGGGGDDVKKPNHQNYTTSGIHQDQTVEGVCMSFKAYIVTYRQL